jgi:positive regulator of sigma E activity
MELLAAIGLILPALTSVVVFLTPLAATGLVVMMLLAVLTHIRRREPGAIVFTAVLMLTAAFVAGAGSARTRSEPPQPQTQLLLTTTATRRF